MLLYSAAQIVLLPSVVLRELVVLCEQGLDEVLPFVQLIHDAPGSPHIKHYHDGCVAGVSHRMREEPFKIVSFGFSI